MAFNFGSQIGNVVQQATTSAVNNGLEKVIPGDGFIAKSARGFLGSQANRLINSGLFPGAASSFGGPSFLSHARFANEDPRVRISLSPGTPSILYKDPSNALLAPLRESNGIVFPYTPTVNISHSASYAGVHPTHSNYNQHSYATSSVDQISIVGQFTANTQAEANYILAVINFMRAATKMFFGNDDKRGTPPPVLRFSGYGPLLFNSVPVVMTAFTNDFEGSMDYMEAYVGDPGLGIGASTYVPTMVTINATMVPIVTRTQQKRFNLGDYARGGITATGTKSGAGGMP
jgi:hypothetical protein